MTGTLCGNPEDKAVVVGLPSDFDLSKRLQTAQEICLATAFARDSGWKIIKGPMLQSSANIKIITGLYCCHTEPSLLREWLKLMGERKALSIRLAASPDGTGMEQTAFHPKVLIVCGDHVRFAVVGSGNLTSGGFRSNIECSIYTEDGAHVDALLRWFQEIKRESNPLSETIVSAYEIRYNKSAEARKVVETAQQEAEEAVKCAVASWKREEAIQEAKAYFKSDHFLEPARKAKWDAIIPNIRKWLDYDEFNLTPESWSMFYKKAGLGRMRQAYPKLKDNTPKIQEALRFLFAKGHSIDEKRLQEVLEANGKYHVKGLGINLVSKFLAAHDPTKWFVYNMPIEEALQSFGYEKPKHSKLASLYLVYVKEMRRFREDCGAEDCVALDSFFGHWYTMHCKSATEASTEPALSSGKYAEYVDAAKSAGLTPDEFESAMTIWGKPGDEHPPEGVLLLRKRLQAHFSEVRNVHK